MVRVIKGRLGLEEFLRERSNTRVARQDLLQAAKGASAHKFKRFWRRRLCIETYAGVVGVVCWQVGRDLIAAGSGPDDPRYIPYTRKSGRRHHAALPTIPVQASPLTMTPSPLQAQRGIRTPASARL